MSEPSTLRSAGTGRGIERAPTYSNSTGRGNGRARCRPSPTSRRLILPDGGRASARWKPRVRTPSRAVLGTSAGSIGASMRSSRVASGADFFPRGSMPSSGATSRATQSTLMALRIVRSQICLQDRHAARAGVVGSGWTGMPAVHDSSYSVGRADDGWLVGMRLLPAKDAPRLAGLRFRANARAPRSCSVSRSHGEPFAAHGNRTIVGVLT
jgi:hypothetical protein